MSFTVTINNPDYNYSGGSTGLSATVPAVGIAISQDTQSISRCTFYIRSDVASKYSLETDDSNNPIQLNSTVIIKRDAAFWFRGYITDKPVFVDFEDGRYLEVSCPGYDGILAQSACPDSTGGYKWSLISDSAKITDVPLEKSSAFGTFQGDTLWPDPADATGADCYTAGATAELYTSILAGTSPPFDIELNTTADPGFLPAGWIMIGSEWFYYSGSDDTGTGGRWRLAIVARAELGTTAAAHDGKDSVPTGDTVTNKIGKQIAPNPPEIKNGTTVLTYGKQYTVHSRYGCFVLAGTASGTYTGTYYVYDEDGSLGGGTIYSLEDVIEAIVTAPRAYGGAGFVAGDLDFDALNLFITRFDYDLDSSPENAWDLIHDVIQAVGLEDQVRFWFDHSTGKFRLAILANGAVDIALTHVERIEKELSLQDCYSGAIVKFTDDQTTNRVQTGFAWHQEATGAGSAPDDWIRTTAGGESYSYGTNTTDTSAGSFGVDMLIDGKPGTKLTAWFEHDPGGEFDFGHFWFGTGAPIVTLDKIKIAIGTYRVIKSWGRTTDNDAGTILVRIDGCDDYNTGTHTGTWQPLGFIIEKSPEINGTSVAAEASSFILRAVNAVRIVFEYMAGPKQSGDYYWAPVHLFEIEANSTSFVFVQTSDSVQNDPLYYYAPDAHRKMRGGVKSSGAAGSPRVAVYPIGAASEGAAISIARQFLQNKLALAQRRHYDYSGVLPAKPEIGYTVSVDENGDAAVDYTGVVMSYNIGIVDAVECSLSLLDTTAVAIS